MLKVGWKCGTELEEDVCSHAVDPEHEGEEGVDDQISKSKTQLVVVQVVFIQNLVQITRNKQSINWKQLSLM